MIAMDDLRAAGSEDVRAVYRLAHERGTESTSAVEPRCRHLADERQSLTHKFRGGE